MEKQMVGQVWPVGHRVPTAALQCYKRGVPASLSPNNLLQMKIYGHHPRLTESEPLGRRARNLHFDKLPTISTHAEVRDSQLWRNS